MLENKAMQTPVTEERELDLESDLDGVVGGAVDGYSENDIRVQDYADTFLCSWGWGNKTRTDWDDFDMWLDVYLGTRVPDELQESVKQYILYILKMFPNP